MSTRASIHFCDSTGKTVAIVFRHTDGYPEGLGRDLRDFFAAVEAQTSDTRFSDPSMLAARWVVYDAQQMARGGNLDFLSVRIVLEDSGDIEYRYKVICNAVFNDNAHPQILTEEV